MSSICDASIHLCRVRVTRLDTLGSPTPGPNNVYVSDNPIMLSVRPQVVAGVDRDLVGGCDCIINSYRGPDKLKRYELELTMGRLEWALIEMLTGADAITLGAGGTIGGVWWPSQITCGSAEQPNVALEAWSDAWEDDHQESAPIQYYHWLWPSTRWQIADHTLQNDFLTPVLTGFTRSNVNWGMGIYGDQPESAGPLGGVWQTDRIPTAACDYQTEGLT